METPYFPVMVTLGVAVLAAGMAGIAMFLRRRSLEGFVLAVFLLLCLPYMQLIPYAPPSLVSDRFLALAVWPAVLLIVLLAWRLQPIPRVALLLAIALSWSVQTIEDRVTGVIWKRCWTPICAPFLDSIYPPNKR